MAANLSDYDSLSESIGEIGIYLWGWPSGAAPHPKPDRSSFKRRPHGGTLLHDQPWEKQQ